jgi:periplasmic protein TonB
MNGHVDILAQADRLSGWLAGSITMHLLIGGALLWYTVAGPGKASTFGSPHGGGFGSVVVNPVAHIPLAQRDAPENPVANDTKSRVPAPPPKAKPQPKPQVKPDADAIALKSRMAERKPKREYSPPNKYREQQKDMPNQLYSDRGQMLSNPMYGVRGGGGVGVGDNSPFGTQFGWYAQRLIEQVGQHWQTAGLDSRSGGASVMFTIRRDGSVTGVRLAQSSGNSATDFSIQRAVLDAQPFPALPAGFSRNEATVTLQFALK